MEKKNFVLRIDEQMYNAIARWAADEFRSMNGQVEWILHKALTEQQRLPGAGTGGVDKPGPIKKKKDQN